MPARPFNEFLANLRFGEAHDELSEKLNQLVEQCVKTDKAGTLTFTVTLRPTKGGAVEVTDDVKIKSPELPHGATLMFPTPENNLQRTDPRQGTLEGVRVVGDDGEIRRPNVA